METFVALLLFVAITLISAVGVGKLRQEVIRRSILDIPNDRSSHSVPTPRGGGALIVTLVLCGLFIYVLAIDGTESGSIIVYIMAGGAIAGISWLDDVRTLSSKVRFAVHFLAAILMLLTVGYWETVTVPFIGDVSLGGFGAIVTLIWIVGLTNAFNFMDGIDGIAGSQALIAGLGWSIIGLWYDLPLVALWGGLIAASSLGFLHHNWHPATIFMGDVGSAFLGFTFAVLPLYVYRTTSNPPSQQALFFGVLLLWPFVVDAFTTFLKRLLRGENVLAAHREHLYQRLIIIGSPHNAVASLYAGLAATGVLLGVWWISAEMTALLITLWITLIVALFSYVGYKERKS